MPILPALSIFLAFLIYGSYAWLAFNPLLKTETWIIFAGLGCAIAGNLIWILLARATHDNERLFFYGLCWDTMITATTVIVPMIFFSVRLSGATLLGFVVAILGLLIMKLGS